MDEFEFEEPDRSPRSPRSTGPRPRSPYSPRAEPLSAPLGAQLGTPTGTSMGSPLGSPLGSPRHPDNHPLEGTPRTPLAIHSAEVGWSPADFHDPYDSESPPLPSPSSRFSEVVHRPVATHLAQVEHPDLTHDEMSAPLHEYEEYELKGSESPYASEPAGIISEFEEGTSGPEGTPGAGPNFPGAGFPGAGFPGTPGSGTADGFNYVQVPNNLVHRESQGEQAHAGIYYPAPVPAQLKLPPLLSSANRNRKTLPPRKPRPRSMMMMNVPLEPEWEPSPIDQELVGREEEELSDADSMMVESDHSSYAMSVLSSSYQDGVDGETPRTRTAGTGAGAIQENKGWLSRVVHSMIGKSGDPDNKDAELVQEQADIAEQFDAAGFTRFDPDLIREEAKRFEVGGVYSGTRPSTGRPTTLIEEIEIRKAGRLAQQRNMKMDMEYVKSNLQLQNRFAHPLDREHQPTLMELQKIAETDYNDRKQWHHTATSRQRIERGEETLADRRARRRAQRAPQPETERPLETLAERRARRRAERDYRSGLIVQASGGSEPGEGESKQNSAHPEAPSVHSVNESLVESLSG